MAKSKTRVVEAVGSFASSKNRDLSQRLEAAMSAAVMKAINEGMSPHNPELTQLMIKASEDEKAKYLAEQSGN